ncbi:MAG: hypothetical protein AB7F40_01730 [Victivallaceae bacterium]|nr:hypothetical protein [Victivallaceae bacterium]
MAESGNKTEDRTTELTEMNPETGNAGTGTGPDAGCASQAEPAAETAVVSDNCENPVDEAKIAELLLEFERESEELKDGYPYWIRGVVWSFATAVVTALILYMLYAGSGIVLRPVLGTAFLTLAVWVGTTFLPVKA